MYQDTSISLHLAGNWSNWIDLGGESKQIAVGNEKDGHLIVFSISPTTNQSGYKYQLTPGAIGVIGLTWVERVSKLLLVMRRMDT